ncbi:hypothetical protein JCM19037_4868 [Geomicrobium sp. JCM 19037]|nr:hypothetical protein [Geomicrobium sp. JCM 19037]GAK06283.1 hypothetical protein JCM19037_4868 [Geomicrobium sp. JCM 19037]
MKRIVFICLAVVLAGCTQNTGAVEDIESGNSVTIAVSLPLGADSHHGVGVQAFGDELEERTDGRITVRPYYDNALGAEREVFEGMGIGIIDAGMVSTGPWGDSLMRLCYLICRMYLEIMIMLTSSWTVNTVQH